MSDRLAELSAAGVSIWLDDISRQRLRTGGLDTLRREQHVVGVTTNPTIFAKALADNAGTGAAEHRATTTTRPRSASWPYAGSASKRPPA